MDDGYDGSTSGDTGESSVETGSESGTTDHGEVNTATDTETASAFDEQDNTVSETHPVGTEKSAETESNTDIPTGNKEAVATSTEVASAFDEPSASKTDTTKAATTGENTETAVAEKADNFEVIHVNCTREDLAGKEHPDTGVPYETKVVEVNGKQLEVTVPKFESNFDLKLESDQLQLDRNKHNEICNAKLKEHCAANPDWAKETFSQKQLDQINSGVKPEGYTWHHDGGEVGHMQLVDSKTHYDTRHTGGIAIWGNTSKYTS